MATFTHRRIADGRMRGFTFIELVFYVAIFVLLVVGVSLSTLSILRSAAHVRAEEAAVANAALALRAMELEVRHADAVYTPTSVLGSDDGQLSLRTPRSAPADHRFAYVDFYLDNGIVYLRRDDGAGPVALTSADVSVTALRFERFANGTAEGIRMSVTARPVGAAASSVGPRTLRTFVVPRAFTP